MKKLFVIIFCCFVFSDSSFAQFRLGVGGGLNVSTAIATPRSVNLPPLGNTNMRYGAYVSVLPQFRTSKYLAINLDIQSSLEGYKPGIGTTLEARYIYAKFIPQVAFFPTHKLSIFGGPYLSIRVNDAVRSAFTPRWQNNAKFIIPWDTGFTAGLRAYFRNFYLNASYQYGFTDILAFTFTDAIGRPVTKDLKNRNIQIGVGYMFGK